MNDLSGHEKNDHLRGREKIIQAVAWHHQQVPLAAGLLRLTARIPKEAMRVEGIRAMQITEARVDIQRHKPIEMALPMVPEETVVPTDHLHHRHAEWRHPQEQPADATLHQVQEPDDNMSFHLLQQLTEEVHGDRYCSAYYCYWGLSGTPLDIMHL